MKSALRQRIREARFEERDVRYLPDVRDLEHLIGDYHNLRRDTLRVVQRLRSKGQVGEAVYEALTGEEGDRSIFDLMSAAIDGTPNMDAFSLKDALEALNEGEGSMRYSYDRR